VSSISISTIISIHIPSLFVGRRFHDNNIGIIIIIRIRIVIVVVVAVDKTTHARTCTRIRIRVRTFHRRGNGTFSCPCPCRIGQRKIYRFFSIIIFIITVSIVIAFSVVGGSSSSCIQLKIFKRTCNG